MSAPLSFRSHNSGGAYGTHPSSGSSRGSSSASNQNTTRRRANPSEYGPFSSPQASFDDPLSFPPYSELPFTAQKRRRQLQDGNSFVKWAMRGVLLSPVVVLVLWSVIAIVFTKPQQLGNNNNMARNGNARQQSRRGYKRMLPNFMGSTGSQAVQSPTVYMQPAQQPPQLQMPQQQPGQGSTANAMDGQVMVMSPPQQQQSLVSNQMQPDQQYMATASVAQLNPEQYMAVQQQQAVEQQGKHIPVIAPLGAEQIMQQQQQASQPQYMATQGMVNNQAMMATTNAEPQLQQPQLQGAGRLVVQPRPHPRATLDEPSAGAPMLSSAGQQPFMMSTGGDVQQQVMDNNEVPQQQQQQHSQQQVQQQPQQLSDASATTTSEQAAPVKQTIYYYDPKETILSQNGDILSLPKVVYDANGNAHSLADLNQAPIYVQPPMMGATALGVNSVAGGSTVDMSSTTSTENLDMQAAPAREAVKIPKWGSSTSQDQTIIVATVAVMALLVGALSARRLRSKSFLASCIENETLEDDLAYDSAYTTTGAVGADSSYNTFGGWKGDLEKFDV